MASFTDAIPQFNPYIQQLPVEAMVAVGMEKQKRYDEGIQRIQSQIDQVAGLDIVRDVDRQYLQSKLNELGSKLRTVAAGDFSNFQLVNSTAGMAASIAKDNNVVNAVQSTAKYRKELSFMEEARQKGESAIQNEYDFNRQTDQWLNDPNVGAGYNGRYRKYIDVDKKWLEVVKGLHSDLLEEDIPYVYNEDGTLNRQQTAEAMQRMSKESVSAEKIQNALRASLSPDEMEQLNINGRYEFRNINSPEQLAAYSRTRFGGMIAANNQNIKELEGVARMASSDPDRKLKAEEGIRSLQEVNRKLTEDMNAEIEMLSTDIEAAKGFIYRRGAIEQFASAHAWEKQKTNLLTNPINTYRMDVARHQLNLAEFEQRKVEFEWNKQMDVQKFELDKAEAAMKNSGMLSPDASIYLGTSTEVKNQQGALLQDINNKNQFYQSTVNDVLRKLGPSVSRDQLENAIEMYDRGDASQFNNMVPVQFRAAVNQALQSRNEARRLEIYRGQINELVEQSSPLILEYRTKLDELGQSIEPITIDGVSFTSEEVKNYLSKMKQVEKAVTEQGRTFMRTDYEPTQPLTQKEELLRKKRYDVALKNRPFVSVVNDYTDVFNEAVEQKMKEDTGVFLPTLNPIFLSTEQGNRARSKMESLTGAFLTKFKGNAIQDMKGGAATLPQEDITKGLSWLSEDGKNSLQYRLINQGDQNYLSVMKGAEEVVIPITPDEAAQLPIQRDITQTNSYRSLISTQAMFNGNSNPTDTFENSYFGRTHMPNVTFNVRADLTQQYGDPNRQYITLRVMTPQGVIPYQYPEPLDATNAMSFISTLTDQDIKQLYLRSNINPQWKKIIEGL